MFGFSPLCVFKCVLKLPAQKRPSHIGCIFLLLSTVHFLNGVPERILSHISCICLAFLHGVCSNASSKHFHKKLHNHIDCICLTLFDFLHCVFANVSSYVRMQSHTGCNYLTSSFCAFSNVSSNCLPESRHIHLAFSSLCFKCPFKALA